MKMRALFFVLLNLVLLPSVALAQTPDDPFFGAQWYLQKIDAPAAWDVTTGSRNVVVAVLDTGVDLQQPDLVNQLWTNPGEIPGDGIDNDHNGEIDDVHGWDFFSNDNDPDPSFENGFYADAVDHGTFVAGMIGAQTNNDQGVAGINWNVRIMPVRILDGTGEGQTNTAAQGVNYAVANGANIINMSFTGASDDPILDQAIQNAYNHGVLVVAAVGNQGGGGVDLNQEPLYPVCDTGNGVDYVLGVTAVDQLDEKADFSNYGSHCADISAPGVDAVSTLYYRKGNTTFTQLYGGHFDGTSVATPIITGTAALLKAAYPSITPSQLEIALKLSVDPIKQTDPTYFGQMGAGRVNVERALTVAGQLLGSTPSSSSGSVVTPTSTPVSTSTQPIVIGSTSGGKVAVMQSDGSLVASWTAYPGFTGVTNVALGDVDGDGVADVVTGAGVGGGPQVRIFKHNGALIGQFFAFDSTLRTGVKVAVGDVDGDGKAEVIAYSKGTVRIFTVQGTRLSEFSAKNGTLVGENVTAGDVNGDGKAEVIVGSGANQAAWVTIFDSQGTALGQIFPYGHAVLYTGITLAAGDVNGDGKAEIVTGTGNQEGPQVQVWRLDGTAGSLIGQFFAFDSALRGGVEVGVNNGQIVAAPGKGEGTSIKLLDRHGTVTGTLVSPFANTNGFTVAGE